MQKFILIGRKLLALSQLLLIVNLLLMLNACNNHHGQPVKSYSSYIGNEILPKGFAGKTASINGLKIYYRDGGHGPVLLLLHGFPEDGSAFFKIMKLAVNNYRVIVPDIKGIGRSEGGGNYDAQTIANDLHALLKFAGIQQAYLVGHDMSGNVAYAFARLYPKMTKGVILAEAPLSGLDPWDDITAKIWHIPFQETEKVPEILIRGREKAYFTTQFFSRNGLLSAAITNKQLAQYASAYSSLSQLQAGLGLYRAVKINTAFNYSHHEKLFTPILIVNGENSLGPLSLRQVTAIRKQGALKISYRIIPQAMHYLADEEPEALFKIISETFKDK